MARLGLDIDFALQRLLGANKERAAANRMELQDRSLRKQSAAEKAATATNDPSKAGLRRQSEAPKGGTPNLYRPEEPSAQRRTRKYLVFGIDQTASQTVQGTADTYSAEWTGTTLDGTTDVRETNPVVFSQTTPYTDTNQYSIESTAWQPLFYENTGRSVRSWQAPAHQVENNLLGLDWTFRQRSGYNDNFPYLSATIPTLPLDLRNTVMVAESIPYRSTSTSSSSVINQTFTSCDGAYIYHSRLIRVRRPGDPVFWGFNNPGINYTPPDLFDATNFEVFEWDILESPLPGTIFSFVNQQAYTERYIQQLANGDRYLYGRTTATPVPASNPIAIDTYVGLYWKFNARTKTPVELRTEDLGDVTLFAYSSAASAIVRFFNNMTPADPIYSLWNSHALNQGSASNSDVLDSWFEPTSYLSKWPTGLVYDAAKACLTLVTTPLGISVPHIFSKPLLTPPASYVSLFLQLPTGYNEAVTTTGEYVAAGWKDEGPAPAGTAVLDHSFALKK